MADYNKYYPKAFNLEGKVYEDDARDVGGCTKYGITLYDVRLFHRNDDLNCDAVKALDDASAAEILKKLYWDYYEADSIENQSLAEFLVDSRLNQGNIITRYIQEILGVTVDGIFGQHTLAAIQAHNPKELFDKLHDKRLQRYLDIINNNPSQIVFKNGWMNRLNAIKFS